MLVFFIFIFGLCLGSFLNVLILRLKSGQSLSGRSICPSCKQTIAWYDNIPLLSFIILQAKCRTCQVKISWQYPAVELISGLLWLVGYLKFIAPSQAGSFLTHSGLLNLWQSNPIVCWHFFIFCIFASILLVLFVFDTRWYILPDQITIPAIAIALVFNLFLGLDWRWLLGSMVLGAAWFGLQYVISRGTWVGEGDIRFGALVGAMVASWQGLVVTFFVSYVGGSIVAIILLLLHKKGWKSQLPMGAFLAVATVIALLWGSDLWVWYLGLLW